MKTYEQYIELAQTGKGRRNERLFGWVLLAIEKTEAEPENDGKKSALAWLYFFKGFVQGIM